MRALDVRFSGHDFTPGPELDPEPTVHRLGQRGEELAEALPPGQQRLAGTAQRPHEGGVPPPASRPGSFRNDFPLVHPHKHLQKGFGSPDHQGLTSRRQKQDRTGQPTFGGEQLGKWHHGTLPCPPHRLCSPPGLPSALILRDSAWLTKLET